ncbi:t-SNARE [Tilletiaria anomala UBC 951]|uniref:t-SNARE n=1 Tax=Tilletiaria anomala (strain ATCC 24038 / CBS 436.72 / UBC 951) TaxID=1037660 RepID=A0A066VNV6_TILAU|nr:t-SNARE [Tilletiaria anomala UBC 951]KDN41978.1 t-SNARE [Tilletiaria anomala UBC 951]
MSFQDLERGSSSRPTPASTAPAPARTLGTKVSGGSTLPLYHAPPSAPSEDDQEFKKLADRIGIQIFKINSNVAAIEKLVQLSKRGNSDVQGKGQLDWAQRVHDLNETTRSLVKDSTGDVKSLSRFTAPSSGANHKTKLAVAKLQSDFELALKGFQSAQRLSAERNRDALEGARREAAAKGAAGSAAAQRSLGRSKGTSNKAALESEEAQLVDLGGSQAQQVQGNGSGEEQAQVLVQKPKGPSQSELEFQETLIAEREAEIEEIESGIHELNEIFRDLGHIVQEQGGMIDNIEYNITSIATNTAGADRELVSAHEYQRKAGRRAACLLLIVGVVIAIVLLALLS